MEKPATVKTTVYVPAEVWEQLRQVANEHRRSLNSEVVWALQQYLDQQKRKQPDASSLQGAPVSHGTARAGAG